MLRGHSQIPFGVAVEIGSGHRDRVPANHIAHRRGEGAVAVVEEHRYRAFGAVRHRHVGPRVGVEESDSHQAARAPGVVVDCTGERAVAVVQQYRDHGLVSHRKVGRSVAVEVPCGDREWERHRIGHRRGEAAVTVVEHHRDRVVEGVRQREVRSAVGVEVLHRQLFGVSTGVVVDRNVEERRERVHTAVVRCDVHGAVRDARGGADGPPVVALHRDVPVAAASP